MPELPEVETMVRDVAPRLVGRRLARPQLRFTDILCHTSRPRVLRALNGARVTTVFRRAKHAVIELHSDLRLVIQPGMTGSLQVRRGGRDDRYDVLTAALSGGGQLVYHDVRRLGTIYLLDPPHWDAYSARLGPEPLAGDFTADSLHEILQASRQAVKKLLMDQHRVAGVGNIYAQEALFLARIDPSLPANRVDRAGAGRLHRALRELLARAIEAKGTTVRDYRTGTGETGGFQFDLKVYDRAGEPCVRCGTPLAATHAIDQRQTTFCWRCQGVAVGRPGQQ